MNDYVTRAETLHSQKKVDSVWKAYNSCAPLMMSRASPRISVVTLVEGAHCFREIRVLSKRPGCGGNARSLESGAFHWPGCARTELTQAFQKQVAKLNETFGSPISSVRLRSGKDASQSTNQRACNRSMWFGLPDQKRASAMITQLAGVDHQTDWACASFPVVRQIQRRRLPLRFCLAALHGWASVGEYRYHRPHRLREPRANACSLSMAVGSRNGILSGDYYSRCPPFAAPNLVRSHGREPAAPRHVWALHRRETATVNFAPICRRLELLGIDNLRVGENNCGEFHQDLEGISLEACAPRAAARHHRIPAVHQPARDRAKVELNGKRSLSA